MPDCCVAVCRNRAVVEVTFIRQKRGHFYCKWHAFRPHGDLRWSLAVVANVEHLEDPEW